MSHGTQPGDNPMGTLSSQISDERKKLEAVVEEYRNRIRHSNEKIREAEDRLSKLKQLEELHNQLFEATPSDVNAILGSSGSGKSTGTSDLTVGVRSKKDQIVGTVETILMDGRRRTTRELLAELQERGIDVGGADAMNNLAAYLSPQKEKFNSDRKAGGWGLNNLPKKGNPDDALPPSGFTLNGASRSNHSVS